MKLSKICSCFLSSITSLLVLPCVFNGHFCEPARASEPRSDDLHQSDTCGPATPEESWSFWDKTLSETDRKTVKAARYKDLITFHRGWGRGIRNGFCLWKGGRLANWFQDRGVTHPDAMSTVLIELYWAHLNGCTPDIDAFTERASAYPLKADVLNCPKHLDLSVPDYFGGTNTGQDEPGP